MDIIYLNQESLEHWQEEKERNVMALGFFDGIHLGHQEVIQTAAKKADEENASLAVMSFFPHPVTVLSKGRKSVRYIMPLADKIQVLRELGVDRFYIVEFDETFASLTPEAFVMEYLRKLHTVHVIAGYDFNYGHRGAGNMDRLTEDAKGALGVTKVDKVEYAGRKISSTWIRGVLEAGDLEELPHLLGRNYKTKCTWDGDTLKLLPYYMLPKAGCYTAIIKTASEDLMTNVCVEQEKGRIYLPDDVRTRLASGERVALVWKNLIHEGAGYAYS